MSCCGKKRTSLKETMTGQRFDNQRRSSQAATGAALTFEYIGSTAMTVVGPISGNRYRFSGHGARVDVDARDRLSLAAVPNLREVQG